MKATRNRERARVNTEERQRPQRNARLRANAGVCPEQANTQEKTLATADLVRDTALIVQVDYLLTAPVVRRGAFRVQCGLR